MEAVQMFLKLLADLAGTVAFEHRPAALGGDAGHQVGARLEIQLLGADAARVEEGWHARVGRGRAGDAGGVSAGGEFAEVDAPGSGRFAEGGPGESPRVPLAVFDQFHGGRLAGGLVSNG